MTTIDKPFYTKFDRFDFEQQIMECWNVTTDIKTVTEYLLDAPLEDGRQDKIANMLMGIEALYQVKFDKLFRQFETLIQENAKHLDRDYLGEETLYDDLKTRQTRGVTVVNKPEELPL